MSYRRDRHVANLPRRPEQDTDAWDAFERLIDDAFRETQSCDFNEPPQMTDEDIAVAIYIRTLEEKAKAVPRLVALLLNARTALHQMSYNSLGIERDPESNEFVQSVETWLDHADDLRLTDAEMKRWIASGNPTTWLLPEQG